MDIVTIWGGGGTIIETLSRVVCVGLLFVGYEYDPFLYLSVGLSVCDVVMIGGDHHHWLQSI